MEGPIQSWGFCGEILLVRRSPFSLYFTSNMNATHHDSKDSISDAMDKPVSALVLASILTAKLMLRAFGLP